MKIIWRDTDLKTHEIDLTNAVDVKINGISISLSGDKAIRISTDSTLKVMPLAANAIVIQEDNRD